MAPHFPPSCIAGGRGAVRRIGGSVGAVAANPNEAEIQALVKQLGGQRFADRESAEKRFANWVSKHYQRSRPG